MILKTVKDNQSCLQKLLAFITNKKKWKIGKVREGKEKEKKKETLLHIIQN